MSARAAYARSKGVFVGSGAFRDVYKTKYGKYVYKFDGNAGAGLGSNEFEYRTYLHFKANVKLPDGVKLPKMKLVDGVIVAEYINGKHPETFCSQGWHVDKCENASECWATKIGSLPITDLHRYNVLIAKDGMIYIIDLGCPSYELRESLQAVQQ